MFMTSYIYFFPHTFFVCFMEGSRRIHDWNWLKMSLSHELAKIMQAIILRWLCYCFYVTKGGKSILDLVSNAHIIYIRICCLIYFRLFMIRWVIYEYVAQTVCSSFHSSLSNLIAKIRLVKSIRSKSGNFCE